MEQNHGVESRGESGGEIVISGQSLFDTFPKECISNIISFTSPQDACVVASVSKTFESAANSDSVWEKFIPQEYSSLIPQSRVFSSKKELYFALCDDPLLSEDGEESYWLEKVSGKKCIMLSSICTSWKSFPGFLVWKSLPESRFEKTAKLLREDLYEISCRMQTYHLSPKTRCSVFIVFKTLDGYSGVGDVPVEVYVHLDGERVSKRLIYFVEPTDPIRERETSDIVKPKERKDGWMEAEVGEFFLEACCDHISVHIFDINSFYEEKGGLIIQGIEFRPSKNL